MYLYDTCYLGPLFGYAGTEKCFKMFLGIFATSYFHLCGTCKMISGASSIKSNSSNPFIVFESGVVDERLRVLGVEDIRIADASIISSIPSAPIAATCMTIAERLASMICEEKNKALTTNKT